MERQPDVLVSIDLGTTFTGVAWMTPRTPIQVINDFPGSVDRGERKVPTKLVYNADGSLSSWGFLCSDDNEPGSGKIQREFFKIFIDKETLDVAHQQGLSNVPRDTADARRFLTDYLRQIYGHVKKSIETQLARRSGWGDLAVVFLFSVPTTWTNMSLINIFKGVIQDAGFGNEGRLHEAFVDLTEAEAASIATLKTSPINFSEGSLFLTVDAGGGTTDLALMKVTSTDARAPRMSQAAAVRGIGIGSSLIDRAFIRLVKQRLDSHPDAQGRLPYDFPAVMASSHHFKTIKHKFGEKVYSQDTFKMPIEGVAFDFNHEGLRVENGRMLFDRREIQTLFDDQIKGIIGQIKSQLDWMQRNKKTKQVEYMILAGGLGSSAYVRDTIENHLLHLHHPNARRMTVIPCQEPQLVVVRGLLLDRQQRMETGNREVLESRIARMSYGVVVQEPYNPTVHLDEDVRQDPYDSKKKWAVNQIQWLIYKGDTITPNTTLNKQFEIRLASVDATRSWKAEIWASDHEFAFLPRSVKQPGATKVCSLRSNLSSVQQGQMIQVKKRRSLFRKGFSFLILPFELRVIVAPADLRFELWFENKRFSGDHEPIAVTWD